MAHGFVKICLFIHFLFHRSDFLKKQQRESAIRQRTSCLETVCPDFHALLLTFASRHKSGASTGIEPTH